MVHWHSNDYLCWHLLSQLWVKLTLTRVETKWKIDEIFELAKCRKGTWKWQGEEQWGIITSQVWWRESYKHLPTQVTVSHVPGAVMWWRNLAKHRGEPIDVIHVCQPPRTERKKMESSRAGTPLGWPKTSFGFPISYMEKPKWTFLGQPNISSTPGHRNQHPQRYSLSLPIETNWWM